MGSCCSIPGPSEEEERQRRERARNRIINQTVIVNNVVWQPPVQNSSSQSCYGEYRCHHCGRFWSSTLSWYNTSQTCKLCHREVYPKNQRELRKTDLNRDGKPAEHEQALCQRCRELGHFCGDKYKPTKTYTRSTVQNFKSKNNTRKYGYTRKMLSRGRKLVAACLKNNSPPEDLITLADLEESPSLLQSDLTLETLAEWSALMSSEGTQENIPSITANSDLENDETITVSEIPPSAPSTSAMRNNENTENMDLQVLATGDETDFSSDDSVQDPDFQPNNSPEILREMSNCNYQRKRAKRGRSDKSQWMYEQQKNKRLKGEGYLGRRKNEEGKVVFDVQRVPKEMKPRCDHNDNAKYFDCSKLSDDSRLQIFKQFWLLNREAKRCFVASLVLKSGSVQKKTESSNSRRSYSYKYNLKDKGAVFRVCKKMFINTINIGEWSVHNWVENAVLRNTVPVSDRHSNRGQANNLKKELLSEFFHSLPKLESHYCRKSTTKLYLEPYWQSKSALFNEYLKYSKDQNKSHLSASRYTFWEIFESLNLSLFSPKKDQCDTCCGHKAGNVCDTDYQLHLIRKTEAQSQKEKDKAKNDDSVAVFTMDLQAVLLCPYLKASALYYKMKLKVHNFTINNLKTKEGFCFLWDESEGGLTADEFSSIIVDFIINYVDTAVIRKVIIYSDGCTYQNRNSILSNALLFVTAKTGIVIVQKYLEKGHTQMECDAMHSTIERQIKNREIYSPAGYVEACKTARNNPGPYKVVHLDHTAFKKYSSQPYFSSIRPGNKVGDPQVTDIRCLKYAPEGSIKFKLSHSEEYQLLPRRIHQPNPSDCFQQLYHSKLPITRVKYNHLQELKFVIPRDLHPFFDNLPHS